MCSDKHYLLKCDCLTCWQHVERQIHYIYIYIYINLSLSLVEIKTNQFLLPMIYRRYRLNN